MIAYNRTYIEYLALVKKANNWFSQKMLSQEQLSAIIEKYKTNFYTPGLFIKIGLFIFTYILISAAVSMYSVFFFMFDNNYSNGFAAFTSLLFSIGTFIALEQLIKRKNIYRSGIDEALLYAALGFLFGTLGFMFNDMIDDENIFLFFCILSIPILGFAVARYTDRFIALVLTFCLYAVFFLLLLKLGEIAKMIMPFALMLLSVVIYIQARKYKAKENFLCWKPCIIVFECVALLVFYIACNYFVIRESSIEFFGMTLAEGEDIPFAILFYFLTALVPITYVWFGLKRKDKILLWIGLLLVAVSTLTFKHYFSLGHPEITLTLAGSIMIVIAYLSIKYLKTPRYGITFEEENDEDNFFKTNAEALSIAQTFTGQAQSSEQSSTELGGGDFGGGGAGSKF